MNSFFISVLSGLLTGLAFIFPAAKPLLFLAPALYIYVLYSFRRPFLHGFLFGAAFCLSSMCYMVTLNVSWLFPGVLSYILPILAYAFIALFEGALCGISAKLFAVVGKKAPSGALPLLFSACWVFFELIKGAPFLPTGYTLNRLSLPLADVSCLIQTASVFGSVFISFIIIFFAASLAFWAFSKKPTTFFCSAVLVILCTALSCLLMLVPEKSDKSIMASAVQTGIDSLDKRMTDASELTAIYSESIADSELVLFPEAALPIYLNKSVYLDLLSKKAAECDTAVIMGALYKTEDEKRQTSLYMLSDGNVSVSSKRHPVPFGEYIPVLRLISKEYADSAITGAKEIFPLESGEISAGGIICFDSIFPQYTAEAVKNGANLLCISTNDSWFNSGMSARLQLYQSVYRCAESGRYGVRSACTGISAVIDSKGRIISSLPFNDSGTISKSVKPISRITPYTVLGDWPMFIFSALTIIFCTKRRKKNA